MYGKMFVFKARAGIKLTKFRTDDPQFVMHVADVACFSETVYE